MCRSGRDATEDATDKNDKRSMPKHYYCSLLDHLATDATDKQFLLLQEKLD